MLRSTKSNLNNDAKSTNKQPIHLNEEFNCQNCNKYNPIANKTCRDHCKYCLYSKHVDQNIPGDRLSECLSLMEPISVDYKAKKGYQIIYNCLKCSKKNPNKLAEDDNMDLVTKIMQRQNTNWLDDQK